MNRWMVLSVVLVLMGVWVVAPYFGVVPDYGSLRLFTGLALGAFALGYVPAGDLIETPKPVLLWRRFCAFLIDLVALFMVLNPVLSGLLAPTAIVCGVALVFSYFWLHGRFGRATLGQAIMGYRIEPSDDTSDAPEFAPRVVMSFVAVCLWPVTIIAASQEDATPGTYSWDRETNTQAVSVVALKR